MPSVSWAREYIVDWYIKDFETEIIVNRDSSLLITERITADCGNLPSKHGIFRILPTQIKTTEKTIKTPVELVSITDFIGRPLKYSTIRSKFNNTTTWKIGDPDVTVKGENYYKITYLVKNAIRFDNSQFDELYWNLLGTFWELEIDNFSAKIIFPPEVTQQNSEVEYYTGYLGEKYKNLAGYEWTDANTLQFYSTQTLLKKQGITVSVIFPKNIFTPYEPSFFEKYGDYFGFFGFLIPIIVLVFCIKIWRKHGKDPKIKRTIIPEFGIPSNLSPMEMGMLISNGKMKNDFISASIINMAVKGLILIKEIKKKIGPFSFKDFELKKLTDEDQIQGITETERFLIKKLFEGENEILLSSLKKKFYKNIPKIKKSAIGELAEKKLIVKKGLSFQKIFFVIAFISFFISVFLFAISFEFAISLVISALIIFAFSFVMPKRTQKGAEILWQIKGFKLYMETAEKYRARFYEKENIFEKFLPYAIVFRITKLWIKKIEQIYGEEYLKDYHPVWYVGASMASFNAASFTSAINSLSSNISSNVSGPSGAGGAGGAGGGGGGGGGGGW